MKIKKPTGYVIYRGPSRIDRKPIICILILQSKNQKTGNMAQTYILNDNGRKPIDNNRLGLDVSICGECMHKGTPNKNLKGQANNRVCYVNLSHGPLQVFKAYQAGKYPLADDIAEVGRGLTIRLGAYGDPAALPDYVHQDLLQHAKGHTAYTHQSSHLSVDTKNFMLSADSLKEALQAWKLGNRTFRILQDAKELHKNEVLCPASKEAGKLAQCIDCQLCSGSTKQAKSIAIVQH